LTEQARESVYDRVQATLDTVRPHLQNDGGDVELLGVEEDGTVKVRLQGACHGCPMAAMTLQMGIERILKKEVPEVTAVENVPEEE
jgi:Fe-S cluster biogenesis protein NfuA